MRSTVIAIGVAVAAWAGLLAGSAPAYAQGSGPAPLDIESWPVELVKRPLTLAHGMLEVTVPVGVNLSSDRVGTPLFVSPSAYYGVTEAITVGVRHFLGLCVNGKARGCPDPYNDLSVDSIWRLWHGAGADVAVGAALDAAPIAGPFTLAGEVRVVVRWAGGPFALAIAPAFNFGLTHRDDASKRVPIAFPLATYPFGWYRDVRGNKEFLSLPATIEVQVIPPLAVALGAALNGPIDAPPDDFGDRYTIPIGGAVVVSPSSRLDVGVSVTFTNVFGRNQARLPGATLGEGRGEARGFQMFVAFRR